MAARGSTTERGYGYDHQSEQKRRLALWKPGDPCARCGQPMWQRWRTDSAGRRVTAIELGHADGDKSRYRGLEHYACNRSAGATYGNRLRGLMRHPQRYAQPPWQPSRHW